MGAGMWDTIKGGLQDGAAMLFDRAETFTQVGRARLDVAAAKTKVARLERDLGVRVFDLIEAGGSVADDDSVRALADAVREARTALSAAEAAYRQVRRDQGLDDETDIEDPLGT